MENIERILMDLRDEEDIHRATGGLYSFVILGLVI